MLRRLALFYTHRPLRVVGFTFFTVGIMFASFMARLPEFKARLDLSEAALGQVLLGLPIGAIIVVPLINPLLRRYSTPVVMRWSAILACASVVLIPLAPSGLLLAVALGVLGLFESPLDVSMNALAAEIERRDRLSIMSACHGMFSLGGMVGAVVASAMVWLGVSLLIHGALIAVVFGSIHLAWRTGYRILPDTVTTSPEQTDTVHKPTTRRLPSIALVVPVVIGLFIMLAEGSIGDWSALYLRDVLSSEAQFVAFGFAAFMGAMALGRLMGDTIIARFGGYSMVAGGSVLATVGLSLVLLTASVWVAVIGFGLVGLGLSCVVPVLFSLAAQVPGTPADVGIAAIAVSGRIGFMTGPPLIGFIAEAHSLVAGLGLVAVLTAVGALLALYGERRVRRLGEVS